MTIPSDRQAGILLHITSLPSSYGIGEIGESAHAFVDNLCDMGIRVWQFLPIGPTAYGDSPYQPLSIYAGDVMLLDVANLIKDGLLEAHEASELSKLPSDSVDYPNLIPLKRHVLKLAASRFDLLASTERKSAFEEFLEIHDTHWLHNYALFRTLKTVHQEKAWPEWDSKFVHRDKNSLHVIEQSHSENIHYIKVLQFIFFEQWQVLHNYANSRGISLMGDVPIYIALDSADAWAEPELLKVNREGQPDFVAGVPPDYFSADGQLWGNPLYDWNYHSQTGYQWWIDRISHALSLVDMIRLDHFRGFESYWSIPSSSETARDGEWLKGPADELFAALKNALGDLPIVAEDLGLITDAVTELRDRLGLPGMQVLQFMLGNEYFDAQKIPWNSVCYTGTHDNDTTVGWFNGAADPRSFVEKNYQQHLIIRNTRGNAESIHTDLIRIALNTQARLCIIPMQDLLGLGSEARMNIPGTTLNNWRWRLKKGQLTNHIQKALREMLVESGRSV